MLRIYWLRQVTKYSLLYACVALLAGGCTDSATSSANEILHPIPGWTALADDDTTSQYSENVATLWTGERLIGSGIFLGGGSKFILTAAHVALAVKLSGNGSIRLGAASTPLNGSYFAYPVIDINQDISLVEVDSNVDHLPKVPVDFNLVTKATGQPISVLGFGKAESRWLASCGDVYYSTDPENSFYLEHSADTLPGFSGGPIFSQNKLLIGIHTGYASPLNRGVLIGAFEDQIRRLL